jgi:photosystem II stability/assembly factor-like uncharacterized protein
MKKLRFPFVEIALFAIFAVPGSSCKKVKEIALPTVTSTAPDIVTVASANCGGNVTDAGNNSTGVTERGICYSSTNTSPTLSDSRRTCGTGTGVFITNLSSLLSNTTYHACAYATNEKGTAYGASIPFVTQANISSVYGGLSTSTTAIYFSDVNHGWAVGGAGLILATTDGGQTWNKQISGTTAPLSAIHFVNALNGWAVSSTKASGNVILNTSDGGNTWSIQSSGIATDLYGITFTDMLNGWIAGSGGTIMHTVNGGLSWTSQIVGTAIYKSIAFTNSTSGYAAGTSGTIITTHDAGNTWTSQISGLGANLNAVCFCDLNSGCIAGENGTLLITTNAGASWNRCGGLQTGVTLYGAFIADAKHIYTAGTNLGTQGILYAIGDGGNTVTETFNSDPLFYGIYGNTQYVFLGGVNAIYQF